MSPFSSYHRVLKKEKRRKEEKILAEMEKNDPEGFAEKMKLLDRQRVKERMTLKHRGVSKFGQRQKLYAKYDTKVLSFFFYTNHVKFNPYS